EPALTWNRDGLSRRGERRPACGQRLIVAKTTDELNRGDRTRTVEVRPQRTADGQIDLRRQPEPGDRSRSFRNHSGHGVGPGVEDERAADDRGAAPEALLP